MSDVAVRDNMGRFAQGNPGGPGRPRRAVERQYLGITFATVTPEDWEAIVQRAVVQAKAGDHAARNWLSTYLMPAPRQEVMMDEARLRFLASEYDLDYDELVSETELMETEFERLAEATAFRSYGR